MIGQFIDQEFDCAVFSVWLAILSRKFSSDANLQLELQ